MNYLTYSSLILLALPAFVYAADQPVKTWLDLESKGHVINKQFNYFSAVQLRLRAEDRIYDQSFLRLGLGYALNPAVSVWLGYGFYPTKKATLAQFKYEQRTWQEILLNLARKTHHTFSARSRLEERHNFEESSIALRFREMFTVTFPKFIRNKVTPVIQDEIFFNLNHPAWISKKTFDQNRLFIGLKVPYKSWGSFKVGYINQFLLRTPNNIDAHIFYFGFSMVRDLV